jgi:hypothetical protein
MKFLFIFLVFLPQVLPISAESILLDATTIYIEPLSPSSSPSVLAEIRYNPSTLSASISSYEQPNLSPDSKLVRIGIYDPAASKWKSSTSLTSAESFSKGYKPTFVVNLDAQGDVLGVSVSSGKIDAGQTREFAPKVIMKSMGRAKGPELNKPVVLSPEGKVSTPEPEKTLLQK